jgi:hypothetical protein
LKAGQPDGAFPVGISGHKNSYPLGMPKDPHNLNFSFLTGLVLQKLKKKSSIICTQDIFFKISIILKIQSHIFQKIP